MTRDRPSILQPEALDLTDPEWASKAITQLKEFLYARLTLTPPEVKAVGELYDATRQSFDCERSRRQLRIPEHDFDDLDARNGFVADPNREWRAPRRASNHRGPSFPTPPRAVRALTWLRNLAV
jgi:hypothetical protein